MTLDEAEDIVLYDPAANEEGHYTISFYNDIKEIDINNYNIDWSEDKIVTNVEQASSGIWSIDLDTAELNRLSRLE